MLVVFSLGFGLFSSRGHFSGEFCAVKLRDKFRTAKLLYEV